MNFNFQFFGGGAGGMLVQKLNVDDLHFEKMEPFDGTMAYAQNKRQQVSLLRLSESEVTQSWALALFLGFFKNQKVAISFKPISSNLFLLQYYIWKAYPQSN